jgi:hypothetical protein
VERFRIEVDDAVLDDLRRRLDGYRGIERGIASDWSHGVPTEFLDRLVDHWRATYDWRAEGARLNAWNHYRGDIDGTVVHLVHEPGKGPDPLPIVLTHRWPWTFVDYRALVGPLTDPGAYGGDPADAFDVVIPSLPGFGVGTSRRRAARGRRRRHPRHVPRPTHLRSSRHVPCADEDGVVPRTEGRSRPQHDPTIVISIHPASSTARGLTIRVTDQPA